MTPKYKKALTIAYKLHKVLYGSPKTHREWAEGFNQRGVIVKLIIDEI